MLQYNYLQNGVSFVYIIYEVMFVMHTILNIVGLAGDIVCLGLLIAIFIIRNRGKN